MVFSTAKPTKENFRHLSDGTILLKLAPGEVSSSKSSFIILLMFLASCSFGGI